MQKQLFLTAGLLFTLFLGACSGIESTPAETETFTAGNYRFYRWLDEPLINSAHSKDIIYQVDPIIRSELDKALQAKGYVLDPEKARFSVDYIYGKGLRMGETSRNASNLSTHPGVTPNRNMDQASIDNAYALGGVKETANIGIRFKDITSTTEVWQVLISKIIDDVNATETTGLRDTLRKAIKEGTRVLPKAS